MRTRIEHLIDFAPMVCYQPAGERQRLRRDVLSNPGCFDVAVTTYDMVNSVHFGDALKHTLMWRSVRSSSLAHCGLTALQMSHADVPLMHLDGLPRDFKQFE
jgi:hypothetical protein